jgi:hypothetical protein
VIYRHEQFGRMYVGLLGVVAVLICLTVGFRVGGAAFAVSLFVFLALVCVATAWLTIEVGEGGVRWRMTFGFPSGAVAIGDVVSASIIPVSFWYGIGIHLTLRGWVWNVSLGRGVQIDRSEGLPIVLGTDDPEGLLAAIERARSV